MVGGNPPYLFNWSHGSFSKNQTNLEAGIYTVVVTDADQSTSSAEIELQQPNALEVSLIPEIREGGYNISENGGNDGVIGTEVQGGVLPYTYLWSNNTTSNKISNGVAGTYSLVLTDMSGCTAGGSATLTQPTELQIVSISSPLQNGYNISCFEVKDGSIDLTVTGGVPPYEYQWSNGAFTEDIGELEPGSYWVIVRDANGAGDAAQIVLTGPSALEASFSISSYPNGKNVSCYACSNGSVSTTVNGGAAPFTFQWEHGATSANLTNLGVGSYNLILTDANGCRLEARAEILGPDRDDWTMSGNAGTDPSTQFIGTTDNKDLVIKTNNTERLRIKADGIVNIPGGLKLFTASTDSIQMVYADQDGMLRTRPDPQQPVVCIQPYTAWLRNICLTGHEYSVYTHPAIQRLGIGTSTPIAELDVTGGIRSSNLSGTSGFNIVHVGSDGILNKLAPPSSNANQYVLYGDGTWNSLPVGAVNWALSGSNDLYNTNASGRVGIGTTTPSQQLEVQHDDQHGGIAINQTSGTYYKSEIKFNHQGNQKWAIGTNLGNTSSQSFFIWDHVAYKSRFYIDEKGKIFIGDFTGNLPCVSCTTDLYKLYVEGGIAARDIKVTANNFPDYVFEENYKLPSIGELEQFIGQNGHLPGIPSRKEVEANDGFEVGDMQTRLLEKIEELSLYIIDMQKQIDELKLQKK